MPLETRMRSQQGLAAAAVILIIILGAVALLLGRGVFQPGADLGKREATAAAMARVAKALVDFAALNRRLPCPARGDLDTGDADPVTAAATCTAPGGVVPWKTLALRREEALDGWGRKISYRVLAGTAGFTQAEGVSMSNCNASLEPPLKAIHEPLHSALGSGATCPNSNTSNCCKSASVVTFTPAVPPNTPTQWLAARGTMLVVNDLGTTRNGNAFALISHGATGLGAYLAEGGTRSALPNASGNEYLNTQTGGTYWMQAQSAPSVASSEAAHFDDLVTYKSFTDLMQDVKLSGREWGSSDYSAVTTFTATPLAAAGGSTANFNLGQQSLNLGSYTVTAWADNLATVRNVGFDRDAGTGIGSIGTGSNTESAATINYATDEELQFQFTTQGRYLGVTLRRFGDTSGERERVRFRFTIGGSTVNITKTACRNDNNDGVVNFTLNPGGDFDEVFVEPRSTQFGNYDSTLIVGAIAVCSSNSSCRAPESVAANDCP